MTPNATSCPQAAFTSHDFRSALGRFATGVTIVTCRDADGRPVGLTASSFNSVSLDPPLILWSLAHSSSSMAAMRQATHYAVHVLAADQCDLAERFARRGVDRFAELAWQAGHSGAPLLDGATARFECRNRSQYTEGDHVIFVGEVQTCAHDESGQPLIFHLGQFRAGAPVLERPILQATRHLAR